MVGVASEPGIKCFLPRSEDLSSRWVCEGAVLRKLLENEGTGSFSQRELVFNLFSSNTYIEATILDLTQRGETPPKGFLISGSTLLQSSLLSAPPPPTTRSQQFRDLQLLSQVISSLFVCLLL